MERKRTKFSPRFFLCCLLVLSTPAHTDVEKEYKRSGFSFFGVGYAHSDYEESTRFGDVSIQSDASGNQPSQRSGAFVGINAKWGFYLNTNSFFGTETLSESWTVNDSHVQKNKFSLKRSEIQLLVTREFANDRHYLLFGGGNIEKSFTRYDYEFPENNDSGVAVDQNPGNVTEDVSQLVAYFGYEYNEFFVGSESGIKYQFQGLMGLPIYSETLNNSGGDITLNSSFDGYIFRFVPSVAWQFNESILLAFTTELIINRRNEDRKKTESRELILPRNHYWSLFPALSAYWSF